jgi:hypothetical protein
MAMTKCHECGHEISTSAKACPGCGAAPRRGRDGKGIALLVVGGVVVAIATCSGNADKPAQVRAPPPPPDAKALAAAEANRNAVIAACQAEKPALIASANARLDKDPGAVLRDLTPCWNALGDADLTSLRDKAAAKAHLDEALNKKNRIEVRFDALHKVQSYDPEEFKRHAQLLATLRKALDAERAAAARAEATRKRREGVRLGMTREDVLASSWGRPRKVNSTTNRYGTHEQWVYDGGYLYFEDGILTSVQN